MVPLHVFAAHHPRSCSALSHFSVRVDLRGKIFPSLDCHNCSSHKISAKPGQNSPFQIIALRTLSFSVDCKPFVCHSYENNRGVAQLFPFWNSTLFAHGHYRRSFFSCTYELQISQLLSFDIYAKCRGCMGVTSFEPRAPLPLRPPVRSPYEICLREILCGTKMQPISFPWRFPCDE